MNQQGWLDLWHHFLQVMSSESIEMRIVIGIAIAFFAIMSLTGIADSFLPRRAARRYAAMYDLTPALGAQAPQQSFSVAPPTAPAEELAPLFEEQQEQAVQDESENTGEDLRFAENSLNAATARRSQPPPPKVFRAQKP